MTCFFFFSCFFQLDLLVMQVLCTSWPCVLLGDFTFSDATHRGAFGVSPLGIFWRRRVDLETRNPNGAPCFDWSLGLVLEGLTFTNRGHWGWICNIYIYIYTSKYIISPIYAGITLSTTSESYVLFKPDEQQTHTPWLEKLVAKITFRRLPNNINPLGIIGVYWGIPWGYNPFTNHWS